MKLVILGGSGSGKSTQAQRLCKYFDIPLISTGEILREAIADDNSVNGYAGIHDLVRYAQPYVEKGELVPDEMMIEFIKFYLGQVDVNCGWILEGYPRTAFQAEELDFLMAKYTQYRFIFLPLLQVITTRISVKIALDFRINLVFD